LGARAFRRTQGVSGYSLQPAWNAGHQGIRAVL